MSEPVKYDLIGSQKAAEILDVSVMTLNRMCLDGRIPVAARGPGKTSARLFDRSEIEALGNVRQRRKSA